MEDTSALPSIARSLRLGLLVLVGALTAFVVGRSLLEPSPATPVVLVAALCFCGLYVVGARSVLRATATRTRGARWWLAGLVALWMVLVVGSTDAAYLAFPLFFIAVDLLPARRGVVLVTGLVVVAITAAGLHSAWNPGSILGPLVSAAVAVTVGIAHRALLREVAARERLVAELIAARDRLASSERAAGVLAERARLARDIHDTVAQGLASVQLLLHAAERSAEDPGRSHIVLARETVAANLAETRRIVGELTPGPLVGQRLAAALDRLAETEWRRPELAIEIDADDLLLPMAVQSALLRVAQGAMANVMRHAGAERAAVRLRGGAQVVLEVVDDGRGFAPAADGPEGGTPGSFGLRAIRERVEQLGGTTTVTSAPGLGTRLRVVLPMAATG